MYLILGDGRLYNVHKQQLLGVKEGKVHLGLEKAGPQGQPQEERDLKPTKSN